MFTKMVLGSYALTMVLVELLKQLAKDYVWIQKITGLPSSKQHTKD